MMDTTRWFINHEYQLAIGLMTGCSGLALTVGGNLIPYIYKKHGINSAFQSGIYFCAFSCLMAYSFLGI